LPGKGNLRVATFNVLNYFNGDGEGGGFPTSRGADTLKEFNRQRDKIISAITAISPDVIGLMELENDGYGERSAIQDLVNGLNQTCGSVEYEFVYPLLSELGTDQIAVGLIYRSQAVTLVGPAVTTSEPPFDNKGRQPLAQTFKENVSNEKFTVVVNHFKSKGGCPKDGSLDDDQGDGQGCWNATRNKAAVALTDWVATDPTGTCDSDILLIGDFNAYAKEDPVNVIKNAGYTNLSECFDKTNHYSYVFDGQSGCLDHAFASRSLTTQVTGITVWHINADEPRILDYNEEYKSDEQIINLYNNDPYRSSDHDPIIVELDIH
jgi:hypothetical protein